MGGSIRRGYELTSLPPRRPAAEHNFRSDPAAAAALFESGAEIHLLPLDATIQSAYDPYAFIRNAYLQNRDFKVHGDQPQNEEEQERKLMEEAAQEDEGTQPAPQSPTPESSPQQPQSQPQSAAPPAPQPQPSAPSAPPEPQPNAPPPPPPKP